MLDRLFRIRRMDDPVFGPLRFYPKGRFWEGSVHFPPVGRRVDLLVDGGPGGPTAAQHAFFAELVARYDALLPRMAACIPADGEHPSGLELVSIDLQSPDPFSGESELTLERGRRGELYSIQLRGWSPRLVEADPLEEDEP